MSYRLSAKLQSEPVGNTCPLIDRVLEDIANNGFGDNFRNTIDTLEEIRSANSELRDWGRDLLDEYRELESQYEEKEKELDEARSELEYVLSRLNDLQDDVKAFFKKQDD